jgi:hypothetical protein
MCSQMRSKALALLLLAALALPPGASAAEDANVVRADRATLTLSWRGSDADIGRPGLVEWIQRSAGIVSRYYGEFPLDKVAIQISIGDGDRVMSGRTFGAPDARIEMKVGRQVSAQALHDDWVLVHEMTHLALPEVSDEQNWLAEGLATYVEGIERTQAGNMSAAALWSEYFADMTKGLPGPGDQGLDHTHTWARTYWGGALFCMLADVQIREQTANKRGLQDALRAIERAGGGMAERWPADRIFAVGDQATGTKVLADLFAGMKDKPGAPDLPAFWADLGVAAGDGGVRFDETARLAAVRRAITAPYCRARNVATTAVRQPSSASSIAVASDSCSPSPSQ